MYEDKSYEFNLAQYFEDLCWREGRINFG